MVRRNPSPKELSELALIALDDVKALDVVCLDVRHLTSLMDFMIVASGRSDRHVRAIADTLVQHCRDRGLPVLGQEGAEAGEWVLVDLVDVIVHIMLPKTREFYELEKLWDIAVPGRDADSSRLSIQ
jgi:ribosome-associated protein